MARIVLITTYNPGAVGPRYVGAQLEKAGHEVHFVHFKELRAIGVPTHDYEHHKRLAEFAMLYLKIPRPGNILYVPYPSPVTDRERVIFRDVINDINPDLICFSFFSVTLETVKELTAMLRESRPDTPILWGGLHCIVKPEECIKYADIVCSGEGEQVTVELLNHWDEYKAGNPPEIPGMWFRFGDRIISSDQHPVIEDLDSLAIPLAGYNEILIEDDAISDKMNKPGDFMNAHIYMFTERGCPYKCAYCIHSMLKIPGFKKFRRRSVDNVLAETDDRVNRLGMRHLIYHDEIFLIQPEWVKEFTTKFKARYGNQGITFTGYVHPLTTTREMLEQMIDAGLTVTGMGIQTGSEKTCTIYDRPWMPEKILAMSEMLSQYKFKQVQYEVITNSQFETDVERRQTLDFLLKLHRPFNLELFGLVIYPLCSLHGRDQIEPTLDDKKLLFWNMLYHLAGCDDFDKDTIREMSNNQYFMEHPEELEKIVESVRDLALEKRRYQWEAWQNQKRAESLQCQFSGYQGQNAGLLRRVARKAKRMLLSKP